MKVIVFVKSVPEAEADVMPTRAELEEMGRFNDEMQKAGIMLTADGLTSTRHGSRISFGKGGGKPTVVDGPFAETKELVAGYWLLEVKSLDEAKEWMRRAPFKNGEMVELRPVMEIDESQLK